MAKGNIAKQNVTDMIKTAFGADYVGEFDKKIYVWADDGGEKIQVALSMTCPKTWVGTVNEGELNYNTGRNFEDKTRVVAPDKREISDAEREKVRELMRKLNL